MLNFHPCQLDDGKNTERTGGAISQNHDPTQKTTHLIGATTNNELTCLPLFMTFVKSTVAQW